MLSIFNPRQTILVGTRAEINFFGKDMLKDNLISIDWHTPLSFKPLIYAISISKKRFSYELIDKSKVFSINFMPFKYKKDVLFCGTRSGDHVDKFNETKLVKEECEWIDCPKVKQAVAVMECEVTEEKDIGDHVLIIAKVLGFSEKPNRRRVFHVKGAKFTTTS